MDLNSLHNYVQMQNVTGKKVDQAKRLPSDQFLSALKGVVTQNSQLAVQGNAQLHEQQLRKQKDDIEDGKGMTPEDEENESIYKTVKKIERKLVALARLERQQMAGF